MGMHDSLSIRLFTMALAGIAAVSMLQAQSAPQAEILVNADIAVSTTWTANNTYNLQKQIYVLPGATLTIQAGTIIASDTNIGGSLAVSRGAQIYVQGTATKPVIFTSKADAATWTGGNPKTGSWRAAANEWGNLTIMGRAYISEDAVATNTPAPNPNNVAPMEGLIASFPNDPKVLYGGGSDNDDSGSIGYVSLRYGGKVIALTNELNGLSLGGIGRDTDIHHVEIMNNVDDGVEVWGGTVNLSYLSIWNIGDDSLDIDQGWRGKAQHGLIVQGYSLNADQGSGVGDNVFETDGAEQSDYQPVTTTTIYNFTAIGQPIDGDRMTAWRDNARVQYRNCIFMDCGEEVVGFDNVDGDGGKGYGFNGTLPWATLWNTPFSVTSTVNAPANPQDFYKAQSSGMLCEISDSVFFNNVKANAYTEATSRGVFSLASNNVKEPATSPITSITRAPNFITTQGKVMQRVTSLNPLPQGAALTSAKWAPNDGFFSASHYRGGFAPGVSWLTGWTASEAFGLTPKSAWTDLGLSLGGTTGAPVLSGSGTLAGNTNITISLSNAKPSSPTILFYGPSRLDVVILGALLVPNFLDNGGVLTLQTDGQGNRSLTTQFPALPPGIEIYIQEWVLDAAAPNGFFAVSNTLLGVTP